MKFSITIDTGYRDIPKEEKKKLRQEKLKAELKKGIDNTSKLLAAGFEAAKKQIPALRRIADEISDEVKTDIAAVRERDPAARNDLEVLMLYSGVHAILAYRVAHKLYLGKKYFPARAVSQFAKFITGIEIHPGATIGKGLVIDHGSGVVIGETAEIGDNCTLYQGVTLGGTGKDTGKRHPTLGNNVMVGAGAKVLGPFRIGDNSKIAAGAVVLSEIPANSTAVGIPARVVRRDGIRVMSCEEELDQVHLPDPVAQQLCRLEARCARLEAELAELHASRENAENESGDKESS
ncbi:MAG: serine O-acetyltransferase [Clostridiales bacterium]|nr:serine O-acetyltransferase [Clostridiales bacterium]